MKYGGAAVLLNWKLREDSKSTATLAKMTMVDDGLFTNLFARMAHINCQEPRAQVMS